MFSRIRARDARWAIFCIAIFLTSSLASADPAIGIIPCPSWTTSSSYGNGTPLSAAIRETQNLLNGRQQCTFTIGLCVSKDPHDYPSATVYWCPVHLNGLGCPHDQYGNIPPTEVSTWASIVGSNPLSFAPTDPETQGSPYYHCTVHYTQIDPNLNKGDPDCPSCGNPKSNPVNIATGNKIQKEIDYSASGEGGLEFYRFYNSMFPSKSDIGIGWTHNWRRQLRIMTTTNLLHAFRGDGKVYEFHLSGTTWIADNGIPETLVGSSTTGWTLRLRNDETETYDAEGNLLTVSSPNGRVTTLTYADGTGSAGDFYKNSGDYTNTQYPLAKGTLLAVTDFRGRSLKFQYLEKSTGFVWRMLDPEDRIYEYRYDLGSNLQYVVYPGDSAQPSATRTYLYNEPENTSQSVQASALTGIEDEKGARFATYKYVAPLSSNEPVPTKVYSSSHAGGAGSYTFTYNNGATTYVDPLGTSHTSSVQAIQKIGQVIDTTHNCPGCTGESYSFDAYRNVSDYRDFNGNLTCYTYDTPRNLERSRVEGLAGSACDSRQGIPGVTRMIRTDWHATRRIPMRISEPLRITTFYYQDTENCAPTGASPALLCRKEVQATTDVDGNHPLAPVDGPPRVWTYTYNAAGQVLSIDGPRSETPNDLTTFVYYLADDPSGYFKKGDLASTVNALGHTTQFTHYTQSGRLMRSLDANGLETLLEYFPRGWLKSVRIGSASLGYETTSYQYDAIGQLTKLTRPDASFISYLYDDAHRQTDACEGICGVSPAQDASSTCLAAVPQYTNQIHYILDAASNRVAECAFDANHQLVRKHARVPDALDRLKKDIAGTLPANETVLPFTQYDYDGNGNLTAVTDPLLRTTTNVYDALNRLARSIDPANGVNNPTKYEYNGQGQLTKVTDPTNLATTYARNGFGEVLTQSSPDTGTTTFTYDAASNVRTKLDARGVMATHAYDAINRLKQTTYPSPSDSVTYTYDSCANGIGRLCQIQDRTGTVSYTYDLLGRVATKTQVTAGASFTVGYSYNAAGQLQKVTTPGGRQVVYGYTNGKASSVAVDGINVLTSAIHEPFGPVAGWFWGNSTPSATNEHVRDFDLDFRPIAIGSERPASGGQRLFSRGITWDKQSRVSGLTDSADSTLSGTYGYDLLDRLASATVGGSTWGYSYNGVGDRLTSTIGTASTTYSYFSDTHRLQSISGAQSKVFTYDGAGNVATSGNAAWSFAADNRATQVVTGPLTTTFLINALGQRVRKASSVNTFFVYDESGKLLGEYGPAGLPIREHVWLNDLPVATLGLTTSFEDLDLDHSPDVVLRHTVSGDTWAWLLNPDNSLKTDVFLGSVDPVYDLAGMADFNQDGKLDLVWRHTQTGYTYVWYYNGTQYVSDALLTMIDPVWKIAALGDFNGDGKTDIVWRHRTTGATYVWYMNGTTLISDEYLFTLDPSWTIAGIGDFNIDGKLDFVIRDLTTGAVYVRYMNGSNPATDALLTNVPLSWDLTHVADFNRDGRPDIVFRNKTTGLADVWYLEDRTFLGDAVLFNVDPVWQQGAAGEAQQKGLRDQAKPVNRPGLVTEALPRPNLQQPAREPAFFRDPGVHGKPEPMPNSYVRAPRGPTPPARQRAKVATSRTAIYYVHSDHLSTPRFITRPSDNGIIWRWDNKEPFANSAADENPSGLGYFAYNLRFPGQYFDAETGTHYNYFRDYDPSVGRYIQSDPIGLGGGTNTYGYVLANPLALVDPLGLAACAGNWVPQHNVIPRLGQLVSWGCTCYWLCIPCGGTVAWSGNPLNLPQTKGRTMVDFSTNTRPNTGTGGGAGRGARGSDGAPGGGNRGSGRGSGASAGGGYTCLCPKPGADGCSSSSCPVPGN